MVALAVLALAAPAAASAGTPIGGRSAGDATAAPTSRLTVTQLPMETIPASVQAAATVSGKGTISPSSAGSVDGGTNGSIQGCAVVRGNGDQDGISYDDYAQANYHWCWSWGQIWDNYGWSSYHACWGCNFDGFDDEYDFSYGHHVRAHYTVFSFDIFHIGFSIPSDSSACVAVDGWGRAWLC